MGPQSPDVEGQLPGTSANLRWRPRAATSSKAAKQVPLAWRVKSSQNPRKIYDTVADNGAAAALLLGGRPVSPMDVDLRRASALLYRNADIEESGVAADVLGHPAAAMAWLVNKVGAFGVTLEPGRVMLFGSFTRPVWARQGRHVAR